VDLLIRHYQTKKSKVDNSTSISEIQLYQYDDLIHYIADFTFDYLRYGVRNTLTIHHGLTLNLKSGDIHTYYQITNRSLDTNQYGRNNNNKKKNNFESLIGLVDNGMYKGEKRKGYWGKRYDTSIQKITDILILKIKPYIDLPSGENKSYTEKYMVNPIFDLLVDFHLSKKKIKYHDGIYVTIQKEYPKPKWLKLNDNKFLPAVLDSYGIKSKYLIAELNKSKNFDIDIRCLSYLCKLFGQGYVDYLRKLNWTAIVTTTYQFRKYHTLNNKNEKLSMVKVINDWQSSSIFRDNFIKIINRLLIIREFLKSKGIELKFNVRDSDSTELLLNKYENIINHFKKGYKIRFTFPEEFQKDVESDIFIGDKVYKVRILKTEEDFFTEGFLMKNCIGKQFSRGVVYIYISMKNNRTKINLEYKKGNLIISFGKANTPIESHFSEAINELNIKMMKYSDMVWEKEKYEYIFK